MSGEEPFGFDRDDLDRMFRAAGEQLQGVFGQFGRVFDESGVRSGRSDSGRHPRSAGARETTGGAGDGVWTVYMVEDDGTARVEQVFATELEALRANAHNTDAGRAVRFLPYGIAVSALDATDNPKAADL